MTAETNNLVKKLARTKTKDTIFNPYNEFTKSLDDRTAPGIRQQNLKLYLNSHISLKTKMLWVYCSPTYLEAKRSGVPLVNAVLFDKVEDILKTSKHFERATKSKKKLSNTAMSSTLWNVVSELGINPIIWPVIPFYTHNLVSKRKPTDREIIKYKWFLMQILDIYKPTTILAIGRDTQKALQVLGVKAIYIEHPQRGKKAFKKEIVENI